MKRICNGKGLRFVAVLLLLLGCMMSAVAEQSVKAKVVYRSKDEFQYAVTNSGVWLYEQGALKWYGDSAFEPVQMAQDDSIVHLAADSRTGEALCVTAQNGSQSIYVLGTGGTVTQKAAPLAAGTRIAQLESTQGHMYALNDAGCICSLYQMNGETTAITIDGWNNEGVTVFAAWGSHLLAYKADTDELALLDHERKCLVYPAVQIPGLAWVQIAELSDESGLALAITQEGTLSCIDLTEGVQSTIATDLPDDCAGLRRSEQYVYTQGNAGRTLYALPVHQLLGKTERVTLTIVNSVGNDARFQAAVDLFHRTYPEVQVTERWMDDFRMLATEMMGGSEGIDIVGIQDSMMPTSAALLLKSGALLDLNQFPELVVLKDEYRDIFGFLTIGGQWYAVPENIHQHPWQVNTTLAEQIGWEVPAGRWTWDDFMVLAEKVKAWNATAKSPILLLQDDTFLLPYFFQEYQANHVDALSGRADYSSDAYIRLLTMWKQLNDDGLIGQSLLKGSNTMRRDALLYAIRANLPEMGTGTYIYPATETMDSSMPAYSCVLSINANTPYPQEAAHFLACYMAPSVVSREYYWNNGQWLEDKSLYNTAKDFGVNISVENETLWNDMLTQSIPEMYIYDISRKQSNTLIPGLIDGSVSPEQFAAISQQLADMALGE